MAYRTRQEIFNVAYRGLASQGFRKSIGPGDAGCAYRGRNADRCAIGWCIPDAEYDVGFEGLSADDRGIMFAASISPDDADFACTLQDKHDYATTPEKLKHQLETFAKECGLTIPEGFDDILTAQEPKAAPSELEPAQ